MLKIYTPKKDEELVKKAVSRLGVEFCLNDYTVELSCSDVVLHYDSKLLDDEVKHKILLHIQAGNTVVPLIDFLDQHLGYNEITLLNSDYFLHRKSFGVLGSRRRKVVKRVGAIASSLVLALLFFPIIVVTAFLIKLESKGPIFYKQKRVGLFNKEFEVIKFRSMSVCAEKDGAKWADENDSRVTRIGKLIRKTRIDEIPQLWNVFVGDMNLIGPRPEREVFIKDLEKKISYYRFRHSVRPGITGYAQVKYPYGASVEDAKWKHRYDIYYIKYQSFWFDIKIILMTVKVVLFGMGR
jgi:exopolysaccharide biosynthesis polyprenyl glycosylphosphotransferase